MLVIGETVSVVLGVLFAFLVTRSILVPLRQGIASAEAIAQGDLAQAIPVGGRDETAQLLQALSHMQDNLARIVGSVREGSESVSTASAEIAPGNHELSARTEQQASASTVAVFRLGGGAPAPYAGMAPHAAALRLK